METLLKRLGGAIGVLMVLTLANGCMSSARIATGPSSPGYNGVKFFCTDRVPFEWEERGLVFHMAMQPNDQALLEALAHDAKALGADTIIELRFWTNNNGEDAFVSGIAVKRKP